MTTNNTETPLLIKVYIQILVFTKCPFLFRNPITGMPLHFHESLGSWLWQLLGLSLFLMNLTAKEYYSDNMYTVLVVIFLVFFIIRLRLWVWGETPRR